MRACFCCPRIPKLSCATTDDPPAELKGDNSSVFDFHSLDHVPPKAVEKIGITLMDGKADEQTLSLCKVIIHFKAATVLYASQLQGPKSVEVQKHIRQMEYVYMSAALTALDSISFLTPPSLLLVQALITGVSLTQADQGYLANFKAGHK
jgi:hypothetical protein